jgi:hypothetical protein
MASSDERGCCLGDSGNASSTASCGSICKPQVKRGSAPLRYDCSLCHLPHSVSCRSPRLGYSPTLVPVDPGVYVDGICVALSLRGHVLLAKLCEYAQMRLECHVVACKVLLGISHASNRKQDRLTAMVTNLATVKMTVSDTSVSHEVAFCFSKINAFPR